MLSPTLRETSLLYNSPNQTAGKSSGDLLRCARVRSRYLRGANCFSEGDELRQWFCRWVVSGGIWCLRQRLQKCCCHS